MKFHTGQHGTGLQPSDTPNTGSHRSIQISGIVKSVLEEKYGTGNFGLHIHFWL